MAIDKPEKLQKLLNLAEEPAMAIMDELDTLNENLNKTEAIFASIPDISQLELIKGEKGDKGDKGEDGRDGLDGSPGINGLDGKDGRNGKDADESLIVHEVLLQIPTPKAGIDGKDGSPDSPQELRDKLETLKKDDRLDKKAIKGLEDLADKKDLDRAISILDQRTQFLINKPSSGTALTLTTTGSSGASTYDSSTGTLNIPQYSGSGASAWGSITGTLSDQTDLQAALDAKGTFTLPSLTTGSVLFSNGTTIAQDNANFFWDDTNNRLGIGTNTPGAPLHVVGGMNLELGSSAELKFVGTGTANIQNSVSASDLYISVNSAKLFLGSTLDATDLSVISSKVGIGTGTGTPSAKLHVLSTTEQLRLGYDASNYGTTTVASTGRNTFDITGSDKTFVWNQKMYQYGAVTIFKMGESDAYPEGLELKYAGSSASSYIFGSRRLDMFAGAGAESGTYDGIINLFPTGTGTVAIGGVSAGSAKLELTSTTEQLRIAYDSSNYFKTTVSSTGSTTFDLTGTSPVFTFSQDVVVSTVLSKTTGYGKVSYNLNNSGSLGFPSFDITYPGGGRYIAGEVSVFGTNDIFFQAVPATGAGYAVFEGYSAAGTVVSAGGLTPVIFAVNRVEKLRVTSGGVIRIANLATGLTAPTTSGTTKMVITDANGDLSFTAIPGGGTGITRSVNSISSPTTAGATASTDYVYFVSGTTTLTLPTAVGNTNQYTVKNTGVATVTIATTSAQTIDGSASVTIPITNDSLTLISDNANWNII